MGTPLYTYVEPEQQSYVKAVLEKVLQTLEPTRYETSYHIPDGIIYYESSTVPRVVGW